MAVDAVPGTPTAAIAASTGSTEVDGDGRPPDAASSSPRLRIELKRQNTSRGTVDEATRTTLRLDSLHPGVVRLFRIDLAFPDEETGFSGDPFSPRLGDIKLRLGFRPLLHGVYRFPTFVELSLPTADPDTLGSGKYQLSVGLRMLAPVALPLDPPAAHESLVEVELQQVSAFAGIATREDIRYTKLEFTLFDLWRRTWSWKFKLKPAIDWVRDGQSGAVGEIEAGLLFARHWRSTLMFGRRLWGPEGIGGTYDNRLELTLSRLF